MKNIHKSEACCIFIITYLHFSYLWNYRLDFPEDHGIQQTEVSNDWQQAILHHHPPLFQSAVLLNPVDRHDTTNLWFLNQ